MIYSRIQPSHAATFFKKGSHFALSGFLSWCEEPKLEISILVDKPGEA